MSLINLSFGTFNTSPIQNLLQLFSPSDYHFSKGKSFLPCWVTAKKSVTKLCTFRRHTQKAADPDNLIVEAWKHLKNKDKRDNTPCTEWGLYCILLTVYKSDNYGTILSCCCVQRWTELLSCCSVHFLSESVCCLASFSSSDILQSQEEKCSSPYFENAITDESNEGKNCNSFGFFFHRTPLVDELINVFTA